MSKKKTTRKGNPSSTSRDERTAQKQDALGHLMASYGKTLEGQVYACARGAYFSRLAILV